MIKVWINGNQLPLRVEVNENISTANKEEIEKNILEAIKKAHESSTTTMKERMNDLTGGLNLNLPGLDNNDSLMIQSFLYRKYTFQNFYLTYNPDHLCVDNYETYNVSLR